MAKDFGRQLSSYTDEKENLPFQLQMGVSKELAHLPFRFSIVAHIFTALIALLIAKSGGVTVKDFVFGAMTVSFLTAPIFGWMAIDTLNSNLVPKKYHYGSLMRLLSWLGLIFLSGFSLLFIANTFLGIGTGN